MPKLSNLEQQVIISRNIQTIWQPLLYLILKRETAWQKRLVLLNKMVDTIDFPTSLKEMAIQEEYLDDVYKRFPHVPAAYNRHKNS